MNYLVIGLGYIGIPICHKLLSLGHWVIGVDNLMYNHGNSLAGLLPHPRFAFHREDLRDTARIQSLGRWSDVVIPLAALVGEPICRQNPVLAEEVNYQAIANLVRSLSPRQKLLWPCTNSGYGTTSGEEEVTEESPFNPISVYSKTKAEAEKSVLDHRQGTSLRLATVFGVSQRMRLDLLVNDWAAKMTLSDLQEFKVYEPHFVRNYVGVKDVVNAFSTMLWSPGVYNFGLPTANCTKLELAKQIAEVVGFPLELITIGDGTDPDQRNYRVSNNKAIREGFVFVHSLRDGIKQVSDFVKLLRPEDMKEMRNNP